MEHTLRNGSTNQRSACVPLAAALHDSNEANLLTEDQAQQLLAQYCPRKGCQLQAAHLPNFVRKIVSTCFLASRQGNRSVDPIAHILHKAWPMRCSVRNFSDIVSMYILNNTEVYEFVLLILHAFMIGVYKDSIQASLDLELLLYRHYVHKPISREHLSQWVQQDNYVILFIAIKEYMVYAIQSTPGIERVLHEVYNWASFVSDVTKQGNSVRKALNANVHSPATMFKSALQAVCSARCFKCPAPALDHGSVGELLISVIRQIYQPKDDIYMSPLRAPLYQKIVSLVHANVPFDTIAHSIGLSDHVVSVLSRAVREGASGASMRDVRKIKLESSNEALIAHEFLHAWTMCFKIKVIPLPHHLVVMQKNCKQKPIKHTVFVCACCRQLREFIVDTSTNGGNAWARGHQKVILDDHTGDIFCGRRIEKSGMLPRVMPEGCSSTLNRSFWKSQQTHMCGYSPLLSFHLLGKALYLFGKMYMFCPMCMCVMQIRPQQFYNDNIRCTHCTYQGESVQDVTCFHCHQKQSTVMLTCALHTNVVHVCQQCTRSWMHMDEITAKMPIDTAHQAIDERWPTNRVMAHCACI